MNVKKTVLLISAAALSCAAAAGEFEGWSTGLNLNSNKADTKVVDAAGPFDGYIKRSSTTGTLFGQYSHAATDTVLLTVGLGYDLNDTKLSGDTFKLKNHYAVYFEPGYVLSKDTLVYGKVVYHAGKGEASSEDGSVASGSLHGTGYGLGVRYKLDKQFFVQAEWERVNYSKGTVNTAEVTPQTSSFKLGIGYQF
jgi:outer membrane immunogenic protein